MAQFSVYMNKNKATQVRFPYLLNIQNDLLTTMQTCVVVPLTPVKSMAHSPMTKLTPVLLVEGQEFCMMTPQLAGIHKRELGAEVAVLSNYQSEIISAMDFLLSGV
ncbi:MAG TPA: CcdB family protein [Rugosibacter sp.]|nr:CcdB family protein [Methylophilus sp.]HQQ35937.1 CcdB family protein [Rugosibacter sp.]